MLKNIQNKKNFIKPIVLFFILFFSVAVITSAQPFDFFKYNDNSLNLVQLTDVHLESKTKGDSKRMFGYSYDLFRDAILQINNYINPDMVVFSGDVINRSDKSEFLRFINLANQLKAPWYYAPGNHDIGILGGISKREATELFLENSRLIDRKNLCFDNQNSYYPANHPFFYSYSPNKNFLVLFMDGVIDNEITANGYFPKDELEWLDNQLKYNPEKKVIIVQHHPVVEPFNSLSHKVKNADEYFKIIDKYSNVIAVLSGHYHATKITQRKNVLHISTPSLVEYPNAFRDIKITKLKNSTKFDIKLISTNLKYIQNLSRSRSKSPALEEGQEKDRNAVIILNSKF